MSKINERKTKIRMQVMGQDGKPLNCKKVHYEQKTHEFLFGCNGFDTVFLVNENDPEKKAFWQDRMNKFEKLFNFATLPFYWGGFEPEEGKPHTEELKKAAAYLSGKGIKLKGHPLCWHTGCAEWLLKYDNKTIMEKQLARIDREVSGFKGIIDAWDVINEVVIMPVFDRYDNAITRLCKEHGQVGLVKAVFDQARKNNPGATLLINDFNLSTEYSDLVRKCLDAGVQIDAIGIQSHQHQGYRGEDYWEEVLGRFEQFNIPIHFTENTFVSGPLIPPSIVDLNDWQYKDDDSKPEFEERQARDFETMYRKLFENHPLVKAITNWDFADGKWLNAPSGLVRRDNSIKPSYELLDNLINKEWHTSGEAVTDKDGWIEFEGFKGTYEASELK